MEFEKGFELKKFTLPLEILTLVKEQRYEELDNWAKSWLSASGPAGIYLRSVRNFEEIEHILALRSAPDDEDGIWHDDGSRVLGFSLSLNPDLSGLKGGELSFRPMSSREQVTSLETRSWGEMIIFLTGQDGFEHKTSQVTSGGRLVLAGWCS